MKYFRTFSVILITLSLISSGCCVKKIRKQVYDSGIETGYAMGDKDGWARGFEMGKDVEFRDIAFEKYQANEKVSFNQLKYEPRIFYNEVIDGLHNSSKNPEEFSRIVYNVHYEILKSVGYQVGLASNKIPEIVNVYNELHPVVYKDYYDQYISFNDMQFLNRDPNEFIKYTNFNNASNFTRIISGGICTLLNIILTIASIEIPELVPIAFATSASCQPALTGLIDPIFVGLMKNGFIQDIEDSRYTLESKGFQMIAELATVEGHYSVTTLIKKRIKVGKANIGTFSSIQATYEGIVKAGFDLKKQYSIEFDHYHQIIFIKLSNPVVFDPVVYPNVEEVRRGLFTSIDEQDFNRAHYDAMKKILIKANSDNILKKASDNAREIIKDIYEPIATLPPYDYRIIVVIGGQEL